MLTSHSQCTANAATYIGWPLARGPDKSGTTVFAISFMKGMSYCYYDI